MTIRAVAFDLDSTLAVTAADRETILRDAVAAVDAPPLTRAAYLDAHGRHLTGDSRTPVFERLLDDAGATDVDPAALAAAYRERIARAIEPIPGARDLVADLRARYAVGLLTNGPTRAQRDKLDVLGWGEAFDAALVTGDLEAGKPDAAAFDALCDALDAPPDDVAYVGDDATADVAGAADAGLHPVQVTFPGSADPHPAAVAHVARADLPATLPDVVADL
jgi:putative hydrolase of the HAD superfamily